MTRFYVGLSAAALIIAVSTHASGSCETPVGTDFSTGLPSEVGLSIQPLLRLNDALDAGAYDVRSLLIVRNCKVVFERYKEGVGRQHNHSIYSVTKSVTATLVGALLYQSKLKSVDLPVAELMSKPFFFSRSDWAKAQRIRLKDVMQMSSGLAYAHNPTGNPIYLLNQDRLATALSADLTAEPGTRFNYSDGDVSITGAVVAAVAGTNLYRFAKQTLFDPLQMRNHDWWFADRAGRYPGGWGLRLRPMDMAKIGQLYLERGEWNGRRIFEARFVEVAWTPGPNKLYGLHWWIGSAPEGGTPYFLARGFKGQRIFVFPTLNVVGVLTASLPLSEESAVNGLVVGALAEAAKGMAPNDDGALPTLEVRQKKGFRGETRVTQEEQDAPR